MPVSIWEDSSDSLRKGPMQIASEATRAARWILLAAALPVAVGAETWQQRQWTSTLYYRSTFTVEESVAGSLYVAAVDEYEVYLNGAPVAADSVWSRMQAVAVAVRAGENHLALRVTNHGAGAGNGLVLGLRAEGQAVARTTTDRSV